MTVPIANRDVVASVILAVDDIGLAVAMETK